MSKTAKQKRKERGLTNKQKCEELQERLHETLNKLPVMGSWTVHVNESAPLTKERVDAVIAAWLEKMVSYPVYICLPDGDPIYCKEPLK